jgi:hypothetical protein
MKKIRLERRSIGVSEGDHCREKGPVERESRKAIHKREGDMVREGVK